MPTVSVIVVNYNGRPLLQDLFESLARQTRPPEETILVDNASSDGSVEYVRDSFPWVTIVRRATNEGFAGANNTGLLHARGDYIALLNSDTIVERSFLAELVRTLDADEQIGIAVPKIYLASTKRIIDCAGAEFNNLGFCWGRGSGRPDRGQFDVGTEVPAATACAMLLRREALAGEPLFDHRLFMYYEEFELSLRIRSRGHTVVYVPSAIVYHRRGQSVKHETNRATLFTQFYGNRNRVKILAKYYPPAVLLSSLPLILLSLAYWNGLFFLRGGPLLFFRAVAAQVDYGLQGLRERGSAGGAADRWLRWMTRQGLGDVLALKSALGDYLP